MIRNTALLTLLVFTFTFFVPVFMQPKEVEASSTCEMCGEQIGEIIEGLTNGLEAVYDKCSGFIKLGKHIHNFFFKHNRCSKCKKTSCSGQSTSECPVDSGSGNPAGCGQKNIWYCDSHDAVKCDNDRCTGYNTFTHRNCTNHTCTSPLETSSYSGSYW